MLNVDGCSVWSSSHSGLPHHSGSPSAMEALRQHRQWLVNFQRDIGRISSTARYNHIAEQWRRVTDDDLEPEDRYPLLNV